MPYFSSDVQSPQYLLKYPRQEILHLAAVQTKTCGQSTCRWVADAYFNNQN